MEQWVPSFATLDSGESPQWDETCAITAWKRAFCLLFAALNLLILAIPLVLAVLRILNDLVNLQAGGGDWWLFWIVVFVIIGLLRFGQWVLPFVQSFWGADSREERYPEPNSLQSALACGFAAGVIITILGFFSLLVFETYSLVYVCALFSGFGLTNMLHRHAADWGRGFAMRVARDAVKAAREYMQAASAAGVFVLWSESLVVVLSFYNSSAPFLWAQSAGRIHLPKPSLAQMAITLTSLVAITGIWPNVSWVKRTMAWYKRYKFAATALTFIAGFSVVMGTAEERNAFSVIETYHLKPVIRDTKCRQALMVASSILRLGVIPRLTDDDYIRLDALLQRHADKPELELRLEAAAGRLSADVAGDDSRTVEREVPLEEAAFPEYVIREDAVLRGSKQAILTLIQAGAKEHLGRTLNSEPLSFFVGALLSNVAEQVAKILPDSVDSAGNIATSTADFLSRWTPRRALSWDEAEKSFDRGLISTLPEFDPPEFTAARLVTGSIEYLTRAETVGPDGERLPGERPEIREFPRIEPIP